ncbi:4Fe-4S binding protein [Desulfoluna butyratoxydans]|uniref:4fe-4s ferredoxin-type iron-sulphur binding domain n=1 Tax=Desulfoluna butyratoxydans TaxID=231438 RepID=A0A4U8YQP6_9BACT|nr:4Fe-4S binding protein [Desulfoluna butyratoxydans]VFQ46181.1 4fe-4s ferredoxin-type iron-sulphur binding domain [Desulfoluna butyratoxydans]
MDSYLSKRLATYDKWLKARRISHSSRVIPVSESVQEKQWVLPTEQVTEIVRTARVVAVQACECRVRYKRCDNPLDVCLLFDEMAEACIEKGEARRVEFSEAKEILKHANRCGLVHLALYGPDHALYALCSCCPCCCHELQIIRDSGRKELIAHSDYVAVTQMDDCVHCRECVDRCVFGAREFENGHMIFHPHACTGCGLCVTTCPTGAISLSESTRPMPLSSPRRG